MKGINCVFMTNQVLDLPSSMWGIWAQLPPVPEGVQKYTAYLLKQKNVNSSDSESLIFKYPVCLWCRHFAKKPGELILNPCFKVGRMSFQ